MKKNLYPFIFAAAIGIAPAVAWAEEDSDHGGKSHTGGAMQGGNFGGEHAMPHTGGTAEHPQGGAGAGGDHDRTLPHTGGAMEPQGGAGDHSRTLPPTIQHSQGGGAIHTGNPAAAEHPQGGAMHNERPQDNDSRTGTPTSRGDHEERGDHENRGVNRHDEYNHHDTYHHDIYHHHGMNDGDDSIYGGDENRHVYHHHDIYRRGVSGGYEEPVGVYPPHWNHQYPRSYRVHRWHRHHNCD